MYWSFQLSFQLGVVSANRQARLTIAPSAPDFHDKRWVFIPEFDGIERHAEEHIKRICEDGGVFPTAASVSAALSWVIDADPSPNTFLNRSCDKNPRGIGWIWSEDNHDFVMTKNKKHEANVNKASFKFRVKRLQDYRDKQRRLQDDRKQMEYKNKMRAERRVIRRIKK